MYSDFKYGKICFALLLRKEEKNQLMVNNSTNINNTNDYPRSWLITGFVTRLTRRVPIVEQELLTLLEHLSPPPVFSGVRVTRSLVLCVCFVDLCLSFCTFSFGHCVVCSWSIYGLWLPLWFLQTLLLIIIPWWAFEHKKTWPLALDIRFWLDTCTTCDGVYYVSKAWFSSFFVKYY